MTEPEVAFGAPRNLKTGAYYSILFVTDGIAAFTWQGGRALCGADDLMLMQPEAGLRLANESAHRPCRVAWLQLSPALLRCLSDAQTDLPRAFTVGLSGCVLVHAPSAVTMLAKNILHRLMRTRGDTAFGSSVLAEGLLSTLLVDVLRAHMDNEQHTGAGASVRTPFLVDDLFVYLRDHLSEDLALKTLAQKFFVSPEHMAREFKKQTGQSIHRYILDCRLGLSCSLLRQGNPISKVWRICGFGSYSYFFQAFKKQFGVPPGKYFNPHASEN